MVWSAMGKLRLLIQMAAAALCLLLILSYNGFCFTQARFLSEQALYRAAVSQVLTDRQVHLPGQGGFLAPEHPVPYASVDEFLRINPGCCSRLVGYLPVGSLDACIGRLLGAYRAYVEVRFFVRYLGDDGVVHSAPEVRHVFVSNCGEAYLDP